MDYATLQADLALWLTRSDLAATIPSFIRLAEADIYRRLRIRAQEAEDTLVVGATTPQRIDFPADFLKVITVTAGECKLDYVTRYTNSNSLSNTQYSTLGFQGLVGPNTDTDIEIVYYASLPPLVAAGDTNWVLTNAFDVYLYGSLIAAEPFLKNDARVAVWNTLYEDAIQKVIDQDKRDKLGEGPLTPTMTQRPTP